MADASPLTRFLERHVRAADRVLEGGCGLGQYVLHFADRGVQITGIDFSEDAIATHLGLHPSSDMRVGDLTQLPFETGEFDAYISLGVIEHYHDGGTAILREARRVETGRAPDPVCAVSELPRGARSGGGSNEAEAIAESGGEFYQYAFSEQALDRVLGDHGFHTGDRSYYDVGRGVRDTRSLLRGDRERQHDRAAAPPRAPSPRGRLKAALLDARPTLKTFAHMQIVCAHPR